MSYQHPAISEEEDREKIKKQKASYREKRP
jgi:hypothetical protein